MMLQQRKMEERAMALLDDAGLSQRRDTQLRRLQRPCSDLFHLRIPELEMISCSRDTYAVAEATWVVLQFHE